MKYTVQCGFQPVHPLPETALEITAGLRGVESIVIMSVLFNSRLILLSRKPL